MHPYGQPKTIIAAYGHRFSCVNIKNCRHCRLAFCDMRLDAASAAKRFRKAERQAVKTIIRREMSDD